MLDLPMLDTLYLVRGDFSISCTFVEHCLPVYKIKCSMKCVIIEP